MFPRRREVGISPAEGMQPVAKTKGKNMTVLMSWLMGFAVGVYAGLVWAITTGKGGAK